jgi:phosphate:Na+ symporter
LLSKARDVLGNDISGEGRASTAGAESPYPLVVMVSDGRGNPVAGIPVRFRVVGEPPENLLTGKRASVREEETLTDRQGYAKALMVLGGEPGSYHIQVTSRDLPGQEIIFSRTGLPHSWGLLLLFALGGGLALFLFGLRFSSRGLQKVAGNRLKELLSGVTANRVTGIAFGAMAAAIIQSSTATTVMLVSFANAGLMVLRQTLGVILGADIGTTLTVQLIAFKISDLALLIVGVGFLWMNLAGARPLRYVGQVVFGFGLVFYGMKVMSDAMLPLRSFPGFVHSLSVFGSLPVLGILLSMAFTGLVHSSAATIGLILTLSFQGLIDLRSALPIIYGANIGTCFSALTASIGSSGEAKRVAWAHTIFKILIVLLFLPFSGILGRLLAESTDSVPRQIANAHTVLNFAAAAIFLPFLGPYERLISRMFPVTEPGQPEKFGARFLDPRVLTTPAVALGYAQREVLRMGDLVQSMVEKTWEVLKTNDRALRDQLVEMDNHVDLLEEAITPYLARVSQEELTTEQSERYVMLLYAVDNLENIGDIVSKSLMEFARRKIEAGFHFSEEGFQQIKEYHGEILRTLTMAINALATHDRVLAREVALRRFSLHERKKELHQAHIERLSLGFQESLDTSTIHLDVLSDLERINYHASDIAYALLREDERPRPASR